MVAAKLNISGKMQEEAEEVHGSTSRRLSQPWGAARMTAAGLGMLQIAATAIAQHREMPRG